MDRRWFDKSDDIRECVYNMIDDDNEPDESEGYRMYDISEGDQITENDDEVLHSDEDVLDDDSESDFDDFMLGNVSSAQDVSSVQDTVSEECNVNMDTNTVDDDSVVVDGPLVDNGPIVPPFAQPTVDPNVCPICKWRHSDNFVPNAFDFDSSQSGLTVDPPDINEGKEIDFFHHLLDYDLIAHIATETNKYCAEYLNQTERLPEFSKVKRWVDTNPNELYCFFGLFLLMPHCKKNALKLYWTTDPLLVTPIFPKMFSQDRFLILLRMLHFDDNVLAQGGDKLYKLRTVIETTRRKFLSSYSPDQNIAIDESLMLWKGRLGFRQYIPKKRKRFGIKFFVMCDSKSGFVLDFIVYTGKGTQYETDDNDQSGVTSKVVKTLLRPFLNNNHVLYVDNWYSSPELFGWLKEKSTGACGTVKGNRKTMPCLPKKMKKGEVEVRSKADMIVIKWCDKRPVTMLTTVHNHEMVEVAKPRSTVQKPKAVVDYNKQMGPVDRSDMMISFNDSTRKMTKWYRKLFLHIMDIIVLNSFTLYMKHHNKKIHLHDFRLELIRQLFECHFRERETAVARPLAMTLTGDKHPLRLTARHFPRPTPTPEGQRRKLQRKCFVCANTKTKPKKRKDTTFECSECNVGLCIFPCFENFHTKKLF